MSDHRESKVLSNGAGESHLARGCWVRYDDFDTLRFAIALANFAKQFF